MEQLPELLRPFQAIASEALLKAAARGPDPVPQDVRGRLDGLAALVGLGPAELGILEYLLLNGLKEEYSLTGFLIAVLHMHEFPGRDRLAAAFGVGTGELAAALGRLERLGLVSMEEGCIRLGRCAPRAPAGLPGAEGEEGEERTAKGSAVADAPAGDAHGGPGPAGPSGPSADCAEARYALRLLGSPGGRPCHVLLYGPPGSGKSAFARDLLRRLGSPAWVTAPGIRPAVAYPTNELPSEEALEAALEAALKAAPGSAAGASAGGAPTCPEPVVVVEGAGNALADQSSAADLREGPAGRDWLNVFLERPAARFIWIADDAGAIAPSVRGRFSFSVRFPPPG
jgi:hypothetical protein